MAYLDLPIALNIATANLVQAEVHLYGSSRLGIYNINRTVTNLTLANHNTVITFTRGNKFFELSNHLGNVLVTITDKKLAIDADGNGLADYYTADVATANDYYPFGMIMPGRKYSQANSSYRYGFNGKEKSDEITNEAYDFGARIYDGRLGRWLAVDALRKSSPGESPFRFGHNNPLRFKDPDGNWEEDGHFWTVYAMAAAKGLSKARAFEIASKAEMYDHYVHKDIFDNISFIMHPLRENRFLGWGTDGGLGTWADPKLQGYYHALTGGLQTHANSIAKYNILVEKDLNQLHTLGDSWSHSYINDKGVRKMWGGTHIFGITLEHKFWGGHGNKNADNISKRPKEYGFYVTDLNNLMNSSLFVFRAEIKDSDPDRRIFSYVQKFGKTKENNIFLYKSFAEHKYGSNTFTSTDNNKINLLAGYFKMVGVKYETCSTTEVISQGSSGYIRTTYTLEVKR